MPILANESSLYPENLLDDSATSQSERRWWVLYTLSRQEKALSRDLLSFGIPFFLPLVAQNRLICGRKVRSYLPVFSGYVFMKATERERSLTYSTRRVSSYLAVTDQFQIVDDLRNLRNLIDSDAPLTIESKLGHGQRVRVKGGSLKGIEGTIIRRCKRKRLLVAVNYLNQGVSVEIDDFMVEPI